MAKTKNVNIEGSNIEIMNAIRENASDTYREAMPVLRDKLDLRDAYKVITTYTPVQNEFYSGLINLIGQAYITKTATWKNPLKVLKRQNLLYGDTIEEVAVNSFKSHVYNPKTDPSNPGTAFKQEIPEVMSLYHTVNREEFYEATINETELQKAVLNENGLSGFVQAALTQLYNSDERDEYQKTKKVLIDNYNEGNMVPMQVQEITTRETAQEFVTAVRETFLNLGFYGNKLNTSGLETHTKPEDIVLFITPKVRAYLDVIVESLAYNIDKSTLLGNIIVIDSFGPANPEVIAMMMDKDSLVLMDKQYISNGIYDPRHLNYNNYLHHHQVLSFSTFTNSVVFTTTPPVVQVTVLPTSVSKSGTRRAKVTVKSNGKDITRSSEVYLGNVGTKSYYDENTQEVVVDPAESLSQLTVKAKFGNVIGETTLTVTG